MRTFFKWTFRVILFLALAAIVVGLWKREQIIRLFAVNSLFTEEKIVSNFSNMDEAFLTRTLDRGDDGPSPLPTGELVSLPAQAASWIADRNVTALLVLKDGKIVHEDYFNGTDASDRRIGWSVSKSYLSALFGILLDEGAFESIDDPVTKYAPDLAGTAYDGATIKNVLQMSSGVLFDEDYLDFYSDINRMGRVLALGGSMDEFAASQSETFAAPGMRWQYVSIDTHVIGMVIRGATGRDIPDLLAEKIIQPLGFEVDPFYLTDGNGVAFVLGGLNVTARDNARFGQMIADDGVWDGQQIVPEAWIDASTEPSANTALGTTGYGYQWWIPAGAEPAQFMARGIYGQYVYIDRRRNVVIVVNSADRKFREAGVSRQNEAMFRLIADSL